MAARKIPIEIRIKNHTEIDPNTKCWNWTGNKNKRGYGKMTLRINKIRTHSSAHRASYQYYKGDIPNNSMVLHICDNPSCVNPDHLYLGNNSDNQKDRYQRSKKFNRDKNGRFCGNGV